VLADLLGAAPAPTAPGWPPFRVAGTRWLVKRVLAGRIAAGSRLAAAAGRGRLRVSHADREQVIACGAAGPASAPGSALEGPPGARRATCVGRR